MTIERTLILASSLSGVMHKPAFANAMGEGRRLLFVPTAATGEGWAPDYDEDIRPFEDCGYSVTLFDLSKVEGRIDLAFFDDFDACYLSGGNTYYLLRHMKRTGFFEHLKTAVDNGFVFSGSSAGAIVATPDIGYAGSIDDPSLGDGDNVGLGFVNFAILPHMDHEGMGEAVRALFAGWSLPEKVFGLNDDQAILIEGDRIRII